MKFRNLLQTLTAVIAVMMLATVVSADAPEMFFVDDEDITVVIAAPMYAAKDGKNDDLDFPGSYHGSYGYESLGEMENGAARQQLYREIDKIVKAFHTNYRLNLDVTGDQKEAAGAVSYSELGLTNSDSYEVWDAYRDDHPLYYWVNAFWSNNENVYIIPDEAYAKGSVREAYNERIEDALEDYLELIEKETSAYRIALAFHDAIIEKIDYAYKADGETPEDSDWAHNILGVVEERGAVCEGYARVFQLLLNMMDIDNIFVTGIAGGGGHAWNLVKMDDGKWYWFDVTWDDAPNLEWGVRYNYFCVNDTDNVLWRDGRENNVENGTFLNDHRPTAPGGVKQEWQYPLPERAKNTYTAQNGELLLRDTFTAGKFTYAVAGFDTVQIVGVSGKDKRVEFPEEVEKNGVEYDVISLGSIYPNGNFGFESIFTGTVPETVVISEDIKYIWSGSIDVLCDGGVKEYIVDRENEYFAADDGVLFNKTKDTLICYPNAAEKTSYTVPANTKTVARSAFTNCKNLQELTLSKGVEKIEAYGFYNCMRLQKVMLPENLQTIGDSAFAYCFGLKDVYFEGDVPENWGSDVFVEDAETLVLHYPESYASSWGGEDGTWTGPDGVVYQTVPDAVAEEPEEPEVPEEPEEEPEITWLLGDVNGDNLVNARDARYVLRFAVGYTDTGVFPERGNVNGDDVVNARDARYILRFAVGYDDELGIGTVQTTKK